MKIHTITSHDVYNYGASLQAYALMHYLQTIGNEVSIIDYKPDYSKARYNFWYISPQYRWRKNPLLRFCACLLLAPKRFYTYRRKKAFDTFKLKYLHLTQRFSTLAELEQVQWDAQMFIAGSDQIWNTDHENGKDPANYLSFVPLGKKRMSYAASFGIDYIKPEFQDMIKRNLMHFQQITVREKRGVCILKQLGLSAVQVVDPVFLLSKKEWEDLTLSPKIKEKYILVYDFGRNKMMQEFAVRYAKEHQLKIFSLNDFVSHSYADCNINNAGPREFLGLIKNTECFISNSFHGTAFSIIFEKQFFVFNRKDAVNSRMESLMEMAGLKDRLIMNQADFEKMDSLIDYGTVNYRIGEYIAMSKDVLAKNIL